MKTKLWILLIAIVAAVCALGSFFLLRPTQAAAVQVWSEGELIETLSLNEDQTLTVTAENGINVVTVSGGKVAVTQADCPDHYCMERGWCSGGAQIVCLPNRLVLKFVGQTQLDGVSG